LGDIIKMPENEITDQDIDDLDRYYVPLEGCPDGLLSKLAKVVKELQSMGNEK